MSDEGATDGELLAMDVGQPGTEGGEMLVQRAADPNRDRVDDVAHAAVLQRMFEEEGLTEVDILGESDWCTICMYAPSFRSGDVVNEVLNKFLSAYASAIEVSDELAAIVLYKIYKTHYVGEVVNGVRIPNISLAQMLYHVSEHVWNMRRESRILFDMCKSVTMEIGSRIFLGGNTYDSAAAKDFFAGMRECRMLMSAIERMPAQANPLPDHRVELQFTAGTEFLSRDFLQQHRAVGSSETQET